MVSCSLFVHVERVNGGQTAEGVRGVGWVGRGVGGILALLGRCLGGVWAGHDIVPSLFQLFTQCEQMMVQPLKEARDKYEMMKEEAEDKKKEGVSGMGKLGGAGGLGGVGRAGLGGVWWAGLKRVEWAGQGGGRWGEQAFGLSEVDWAAWVRWARLGWAGVGGMGGAWAGVGCAGLGWAQWGWAEWNGWSG